MLDARQAVEAGHRVREQHEADQDRRLNPTATATAARGSGGGALLCAPQPRSELGLATRLCHLRRAAPLGVGIARVDVRVLEQHFGQLERPALIDRRECRVVQCRATGRVARVRLARDQDQAREEVGAGRRFAGSEVQRSLVRWCRRIGVGACAQQQCEGECLALVVCTRGGKVMQAAPALAVVHGGRRPAH